MVSPSSKSYWLSSGSVASNFRETSGRVCANVFGDVESSSSKSERIHEAIEKGSWNLNGVAFSGRHRKKGGGPEMLTNERQRIGKGRQGFAIPGGLTNGKGVFTQQLLRKNGHERKECQQGRSGAQNRQIRPLALGLDAQMSTNFMKGDFNCPAQDKPLDDLESLCLLIGTQQGQWLVPALWITNEHPTDRNRGNGRLIPQRRASGDLHLARCPPIPGQRLFSPLRRRIVEALRKFRLRFAFEGMATSFSCFTRWGRIVHTRIQAQAGNDAHQRQAAHASRKNSSTAYVPSATTTSRRPGSQRETCRSICQAHSVIVLCRIWRSAW